MEGLNGIETISWGMTLWLKKIKKTN